MNGKIHSLFFTIVKVSIVAILFTGCASVEQARTLPNDPDFAPILPEMEDEPLVPTGSLFKLNYVNNIYSDSKAHRVGDIISVILSESTQSQKSAKTELSKDNNASLSPITGFGGAAINFDNKAIQFGYNQSSDFSGDSKANGNLMIRGEKWMSLNNGDEFIRLTGIVRSQDISSGNTVTSSKVANARIEYAGTGSFADVQEQGWLSKFFSSSWWPI